MPLYEFKITSVPPPPDRYEFKYPFHKLEVGESFFVPKIIADDHQVRSACTAYARRRKHKVKFTIKKYSRPGGCRVWRIE